MHFHHQAARNLIRRHRGIKVTRHIDIGLRSRNDQCTRFIVTACSTNRIDKRLLVRYKRRDKRCIPT